MKTKALFILVTVIVLILGCGSNPRTTAPDDLDLTLRQVSDYLNERIPTGRKIAVISIQSGSSALSEYIIDELISNAVNDNRYSVVDRQQLDIAREELNLNLSGEISDNSAQSVGQFLGVQIIVTGRVSQIGDNYRISIRALEVETVQVQGSNNWNISAGKTITALMNTRTGINSTSATTTTRTQPTTSASTVSTNPAQPVVPVTPPTSAYRIGDTGPAGGIIFYDKGNNSGGWRYLEAAPANTEFKAQFGRPNGQTRDDLGSGRENTQNLKVALEASGDITMAAHRCTQLNINGHTDWFLPSKAELSWMYVNLKEKGIGDFSNDWYWSSSNGGYWFRWWGQRFSDGTQSTTTGENNSNDRRANSVRAIRQF
jgi:TolB-like protein